METVNPRQHILHTIALHQEGIIDHAQMWYSVVAAVEQDGDTLARLSYDDQATLRAIYHERPWSLACRDVAEKYTTIRQRIAHWCEHPPRDWIEAMGDFQPPLAPAPPGAAQYGRLPAHVDPATWEADLAEGLRRYGAGEGEAQ